MSYVTVAVAGMNALQQVSSGRTANLQGQVRGQALDYAAQQEQEAALETARMIRRAGQRQVGQVRGAIAASGVKVDEGSAADVQAQVQHDSEMDAFQALLEGGRRSRSLQVDAAGARAQGRAAQAAGYVNATGTLLGGFNASFKANGWRTNGQPGFAGGQRGAPIEDRSYYGPR